MSKLNKNDYIKILKFYKMTIPKTLKGLKNKTQIILANKLCRCIKKFDKKYEARSIGICTRSVFNTKGLTRQNFTCKGRLKNTVTFKKRK